MKSAIEQAIKEKIKALAKERETTFAELWKNLILERFLTRLASSSFRDKFVLKGGTLLAKYLPLGRETQDLDFFIQRLSNTEQSLKMVLQTICDIDANDSFVFEVTKIKILDHVHLAYTGAEVSLLAKFGATKTVMRMDLGFGDCVKPVEYPMDLTATSRGPLFESKIFLQCYPKEFIFSEKLETLVFRGASNTRMKDFHDLYSLIHLGDLEIALTEKAIQLVFQHRKTSLRKLPIAFDQAAFETLQKSWNLYRRKLKKKKDSLPVPESIEDVVLSINQWLKIGTP
jgi:predicted nucleotidyltransferase component of viral defense system